MAESKYRNHFDLEFALEESHREHLSSIINHPKMLRQDIYFVMCTAKCNEDNVIRMVFTTTKTRPPQMLNTICYKVDNRLGLLFKEWVAPMDIPIPDALVVDNTFEQSIAQGAGGLPIINA